jgi:uncharacterized secreted repeat protein (TIGR03808 family)
MTLSRRTFIAASTTSAAAGATALPAQAAPANAALGIDAAELGVRPDSPQDQTQALQRAIDRATLARLPLLLAPGIYRTGELWLTPNTKIAGTRGSTRLELASGPSLFNAQRADNIELSGLVIDGMKIKPGENRGLVHLKDGSGLRLADCSFLHAGQTAVILERCGGTVTGCTVEDAGDSAIRAIDSTGLRIAENVIRRCGNNGIQVWRSAPGDDGTMVTDNRIEDIRADAGGDGPYGNAINVFRAGNVIVRGNRIDKCVFSAVRGNSASGIQILGNICTRLGECAIWSEFSFEGAVIANNTVDGALVGIAVANFNFGGRLAVVSGNILRNIRASGPHLGIGLSIEADSVVSGNVIEIATSIGIRIGYGPYLRDVIVSNNVLRGTGTGIAVTVVKGAGNALISDNLIEASEGAIVGMEWEKRVTGDMAKDGAGRHAHLTLNGNRVR